jgi:phosphatidylserine/phosphatidylglycerophosphate/cardiolipin synthase-like enzyme
MVPNRKSEALDPAALREIAVAAMARTSGSPRTEGNGVRVLHDAPENYPAWEAAIASARKTVHMEMYIFRDDRWGQRFAALLAERAAAGVRVRVLCDWFGCWSTPHRLFRSLVDHGGTVRYSNPLNPANPLAAVRRNHRKVICVDGSVAFISGLCIADPWMGDPARGIPPWRDTGVELKGPAVADAEEAFARSWREFGGAVDDEEVPARETIGAAGTHGVRVIASTPETARLLRVDLLVAALARQRLWLTDAYFIGNVPYLQALRNAAADGVDVRLLLPSRSDIRWIAATSRSRYRSLLEAGIRIFEWRGPMLHAKSAVADGLWTRIGSTNLNVGSWMNNWEMDVSIEDAAIAGEMEAQYEEDLQNADEIVRSNEALVVKPPPAPKPRNKGMGRGSLPTGTGSGGQLLSSVGSLGSAVGAAVTGQRPLEGFECAPLMTIGAIFLLVAAVGFWKPQVIVWPIAVVLALLGLQLLSRGIQSRLRALRHRGATPSLTLPPSVPDWGTNRKS